MSRGILQTLIGCLLALAVGVIAAILPVPRNRRVAIPAHNPTPLPAFAPGAGPDASPATRPRNPGDDIGEALRNATGANRWPLLLSAAEKATAQEMPDLLRVVADDPAAIRLLAARWVELDPKHMFVTLCAEYLMPEGSPGTLPTPWVLSSMLFEQWTRTDLTGATKALGEVQNSPVFEKFSTTLAKEVLKVDVEQGLRVMKEWNIQSHIPDLRQVAEWAARDPRHAAEVVVKFGNGSVGLDALKQVGKAWAQRDPEAGLRFAASLDQTSRATLGTEVIRHWAERNVAAAAAFAAAQPDLPFRSALAQGLVSAWGKKDPAAALAWSQEHLRGASRAEAIAGLIKSAAEKSLATASELVADMEPGAAQNLACASIFETWFKRGKDERNAAFEWLASLPDAQAQRAALGRLWNWASTDPEGVRDFIAGPYGHLATSSLLHQLARREAAKNPEATMEWASGLPADRGSDARNAVLENWLGIRPEAATAYARKLPAGPERERAIRTVSQTLVSQSPQQAVEWYRSLPTAEQKIAREMFDRTGLKDDERRQLEQALKKP
jgi:hypothetical protein